MFILKQGNLIAYVAKTEDEMNSVKDYLLYDEITETEEIYVLKNGLYLTESDAISEAKENKLAENTTKAKQAVENGFVTYKNAQFETNAQTVGDLTATMLILQAGEIESYTWLSKDDKAVELTLEDFITLGNLIAEFKNTIWSNKYIGFKTAIENAQTLEDLEEIEIDYDDFDV